MADALVLEHHDGVRQADRLFQRVGHQQHAAAVGAHFAYHLVDALLGADVDAARGVVEQNDVRAAAAPFGDHHLLLVAAGKLARIGVHRRRLDRQARHPLRGGGLFGRHAQHARPAVIAQLRQGHVFAYRHAVDDALDLAFARDITHAAGHRPGRALALDRLPLEPQAAGGRLFQAEQGAQDGFAAAALHAHQAEHLAAVQTQADVLVMALAAQGVQLDQHLGAMRQLLVFAVVFDADLAPHHLLLDLFDLRLLAVDHADHLAVLHHIDAVRNLDHLVEAVRHEDKGGARTQLAYQLEQQLSFLFRQHRGRLVEQDHQLAVDALFQGQHLGQFHHLALGERQPRRDGLRVDSEVHLVQLQAGGGRHLLPVDHAEGRELLFEAEEDIFHHAQVGQQRLFLEHHADAGLHRGAGAGEAGRLAVDQDLAAIVLVAAVQHLHQGRLAGAVLADQADDLAIADLEIDTLQGAHIGEVLFYFAKFEHGGHFTKEIDLRSVDSTTAMITSRPSTPSCR